VDARAWLVRAVRGPDLPSYHRSRDELGGVPWRQLEQSDAWFINSTGALRTASGSEIEIQPSRPLPSLAGLPASDSNINLRAPLVSRRVLMVVSAITSIAVAASLVIAHAPVPTAPVPSVTAQRSAAAPPAARVIQPPAVPSQIAHRNKRHKPKTSSRVHKPAHKRTHHHRHRP
jgi:hypothetical protein